HRSSGQRQRLGPQREAFDLPVLAFVTEMITGPGAAQNLDEFTGPGVAFVMFKPRHPERIELGAIPTAGNMDGPSAAEDLVCRGALFGHYDRMKNSRQNGGND